MDISDGLLQDASHIAKASGVCLTFTTADIPISQSAIALYGTDAALEFALCGGDDYQLLFSAPLGAQDALNALGCHCVGQVEKRSSDWVLLDGQPVTNKITGYQHF
jgi:thiamine-monophosphate kinase